MLDECRNVCVIINHADWEAFVLLAMLANKRTWPTRSTIQLSGREPTNLCFEGNGLIASEAQCSYEITT